jgi:hypothetical protein
MIYPGIPLDEWVKKYSLDLTPDRCLRCRKLLQEWRPFASKELRGAITTPHGCPPEYDHKVFVWVDPAQRNDWENLVKG